MTRPDIGLDVDCLRLPPKEALRTASDLGFRSVELATVKGDVAARNLGPSARRHLARFVDGLGLRLAALVADFPGLHLTDSKTVDERIARTTEVIGLAAGLRVPIVTASVGPLTHPESGEPSATAIEALSRIGEFADHRGVHFALRFSSDDGDRIARVLGDLGCPSIRVCLDPGAMVMHGVDPLRSIERYIDQIVLFHARDGRVGSADGGGSETRLGEGDVDFAGVLAVLGSSDYHAPHIVRRTDAADPQADIVAARNVLSDLMSVS